MRLKGPLRYPLLTSRGSLLIVTLWMIAILAILSVSIGQHVRQKIALADRIEVRNWLCGVSEIGIAQAVYKLRQKKEADEGYLALNDTYTSGRKDFFNVPVGDATYTVSYVYKDPRSGKSKIHYGVEDEEGKVNINVADAKSLSEFFQKIGRVELELADQIGYSVADWRDTDDSLSHPDYGAEDDFYEDLEAPYESKDYKFESIEELLLVRGMTPELYETVRPFVTVYGQGVVNINTAPREVLLWLGMDDSLADKIIAFREGADLEEGTPDDNVFTQPGDWNVELAKRVKLTGNDSALLNQIMATKQVGINSKYFRIRSMGALPRKHQAMEIEAVADLEGKILSWSMGTPRRMTLEELQEAGQERVE